MDIQLSRLSCEKNPKQNKKPSKQTKKKKKKKRALTGKREHKTMQGEQKLQRELDEYLSIFVIQAKTFKLYVMFIASLYLHVTASMHTLQTHICCNFCYVVERYGTELSINHF